MVQVRDDLYMERMNTFVQDAENEINHMTAESYKDEKYRKIQIEYALLNLLKAKSKGILHGLTHYVINDADDFISAVEDVGAIASDDDIAEAIVALMKISDTVKTMFEEIVIKGNEDEK
jgi:hypothetical protein